LSESDRNAIVLRFFEGKALKEVGAALGTTDDAAKMRINRAIEKLRAFFLKRGITLSTAGLAASICENSVQAAPAGLAASVTLGVSQGAALAASTSTLAAGTLKLMAWSKLNIAIGMAAVAIMAVEWSQISTAKQQAAQLQEQLQHQTQLYQTQQAEVAKLDKENTVLHKQIQSAAHETAKARNINSMAKLAPSAASGKKGNMMADLLKDPTMMNFLRDQQATFLKKQYDPLVKQLNLTPEQSDAFYQLLLDNQMTNMQRGASLLSGGSKADAAQAIRDSQQAMGTSLQALLGDAGYAQYQEYQSMAASRMELDQMKSDFADNPLTDDQQQQLVQSMKTAQSAMAGTNNIIKFDVTDPAAAMQQNLQQQEAVNQQVLEQAADFLSEAQLQTLATSQSNRIALERTGYEMAQRMFGMQSNGGVASGQ
jgi:hypothetical protein